MGGFPFALTTSGCYSITHPIKGDEIPASMVTKALPPLSSSSRRKHRTRYYLLLLPALLLFFFFFIIPLAAVALISLLTGNPVNDPDVALTLKNYAKLLSDIYYLDVLLVTLRIGLYTTLACLIIGYPLAYQMARMRSKNLRTLMLMAVLLRVDDPSLGSGSDQLNAQKPRTDQGAPETDV
jgi:hypothetical protein